MKININELDLDDLEELPNRQKFKKTKKNKTKVPGEQIIENDSYKKETEKGTE